VGPQVWFLQSTSIAGTDEDACLEHIYCSRYNVQCLRSVRFARASYFETLHALVETLSTALNHRLHSITTLAVDRVVMLSRMRHLSILRHTYALGKQSVTAAMLRAPTRSCKQSTDVCV
jgi:hypothetical protein